MELMKYTQGHIMVFYFKEQWTHFSPLSPTTSICFIGTTSRENFQKILTPSKITLPLHRFVKKFLKIFQAHGNYIASSPPPPPLPTNSHSVPSASKWTSKRILPQRRLVAIQRKVRDDLHHSVVQWTAGTFQIELLLS